MNLLRLSTSPLPGSLIVVCNPAPAYRGNRFHPTRLCRIWRAGPALLLGITRDTYTKYEGRGASLMPHNLIVQFASPAVYPFNGFSRA